MKTEIATAATQNFDVPQTAAIQLGKLEEKPSKIKKLSKQAGLTTMETMIVMGIIVMFLGFMASKFTGDSSKAVRLYSDMQTIADSTNRANLDMGGIPSKLSVLWLRTDATAANMFNGIAGTTTWAGTYIDPQPTDASNNITIKSVNDAAVISIAREAANAATNGGNFTWVYYLRASNVPNTIITEAIKKCSGTDTISAATFVNGKCRATLGTGSTEYGTFDMKVADSR